MRKSIKRVIAGVLSAVLSLSLVNFSALSMSLASELSGYGITVEYSEDNTSATLVGEVSGVKENVQLDKLVDSEGQELDPYSFSQVVEENGTYHFTLYYQETVDSQDADQPATEEKTQELEVVVNGIGKPKADQPAPTATPEVQEGVVMGGEDEKDAPSPFVEKVESMTAAPKTVPLDLLQRNMAQAKAAANVQIYADEAEFKLQNATFNGGKLVAGAAGLPTVNGRTFVKADYIIDGSTISRAINGLYYYNSKWYYTVGENSVNDGDAGTMYLGFELPDNATVRLFYKITNTQKYQLNASGSGADLASDFQMYLNGKQSYKALMYPQGTKIVLNFVMPVTLSGLVINIPNIGNFNITSAKKLGSGNLTEKQIWETSSRNYTLVFTMPNRAVNITFNATKWASSDTRYFALGTDFTPGSNEKFGDTQYSDFYGDFKGSFFKAITNRPALSPGLVSGAEVNHTSGGLTYSPRPSSFKVYNRGSSTGAKGLQFAQGSFRSNQMVGFVLRMDRRAADGSYTWKANSLTMNVYVGVPYNATTTNFRQYTIKLAHTTKFGTDSTAWTNLDCGARVQTDCWAWDADSYFYRIYVYDMNYNFTLYDRPVKTNQSNFVITEMNGMQVAEPGKNSVGDLSVSFATNKDVYDGTGYPIRINDDWTAQWLGNVALNQRQKQLYLRPMYGYTAPQGSLKNNSNKTSLTSLGQTLQSQNGQLFYLKGLYHFALQSDITVQQGNKGYPIELAFNSKPIKLQVVYCGDKSGGNQYNNPNITLSASENSAYTIQKRLPSNVGSKKLKGYAIWMETTFYKNDMSGKQHTETVQISSRDDKTNGLWYPNQIISFSDVYDALQEMGRVTVKEVSQLRIVPVYLSGSETAVQAKWELKLQDKYADLNTGVKLTNANAEVTPKNIDAYVGSTVSLYGNKERIEKNGKKYLYNDTSSKPTGTVTVENPIAASLEYVLATEVTVDTATLGTGHNYNAWKSNIEGKWFTSVNNFNHAFDLKGDSGLNPGTKTNKVFDTWGIKKSDGTVVRLAGTMMNDAEIKLNFYNIGKYHPNVWTDIFETRGGTCTLVALWKSNVEPIYSVGGGTGLKTNNPVYVASNDADGFEISAVFKYGDKTVVNSTSAGTNQVTLTEIQNKINSKDIKLVVLKKPGNAGTTNPWKLWYSENAPGSNGTSTFPIERTGITVATNQDVQDGAGGFKVTFKVNRDGIDPPYEDGAVYRIFAWSASNDTSGDQGLETLQGSGLLNAMNQNQTAKLNLIPCVKTDVHVVYKITLNGTSTGVAEASKEINEGSSAGFDISAAFKFGAKQVVSGDTATGNQITASMIKAMIDAGAIKLAVLKEPATEGTAWKLWYSENAAQINNGSVKFPITFSGVEAGTGEDAGKFKVTFNVNNGTELDGAYEDGAIYRIFAWTSVNGDNVKDLTGAQLRDAVQNNTDAIISVIPSVQITTPMLYKVKSSDGSITNKDSNVEIYEGGNSFKVSGTFRYGKASVNSEEINALYNNGNGKLKIALIKQAPDGGNWATRVEGGTASSGFSTPVITGTGNAFKVEFTVSGSSGAAIDPAYNDGANFRIFVWTAANDGGDTLNADTICSTLNNAQANTNPYDGKIPSVNVAATMLYKVTTGGGTTIVDTPAALEINEGAASFTLTGTFRYGDTTANQTKLGELFNNGSGKLKIGLLKKEPSQNTWTVLQYGDGTGMLGKPSITKADGVSDFTVTFTVNKDITGQKVDGASFRILVWTDANAKKDANTSLTITDIMNTLNGAAGANPYDGKIPSVTTNTTMLYKVKSSDGNITNEDSSVEIKQGATSFKVSGTFQYGKTGATADDIEALYDNGNGKLKIALVKQAPSGNWATSADGETFSTPVITGAGDAFNVEFTVSGSPIDPASNHGANFRILVWTAANEGGQDLDAEAICAALNGANGSNPYNNKIPSVNVAATMLYIEPITNVDGNMQPKTNSPVYVVDGDTAGFEISAVFKYGTKTVVNTTPTDVNQIALSEIKAKIESKDIKLVVFKKPANAETTNPWELWYSENAAQSNVSITLEETTVDTQSGGFKVTFKVNKGNAIDLSLEGGAEYRIFAWSAANDGTPSQDLANLEGSELLTALNGNMDAIISLIPSVTTKTIKLEKITTDGVNVSQISNPVKGIQAGSTSGVEITASFKYGDKIVVDGASAEAGQVLRSEIERMITNGDIKLVVTKKPANGSAWKLWYSENDAQPNVDDAYRDFPITVTGVTVGTEEDAGKFTVTFKVYDGKELNENYEDGAVYRISAWTAANGTPEHPLGSFTGANLRDALNGNQEDTLKLIPSVSTKTLVLRKITLDGSSTGVKANADQYIFHNSTAGAEITASFKYGNKTVVGTTPTGNGQISVEEIQQLLASGDIKLVVTKKPATGGAWKLWYSENKAQPNVDNASKSFPIKFTGVTVGDNGKFTVTFKVNEGDTLNKTYEDGAIYRVFSWTVGNNKDNVDVGSLNGKTLLAELNGTDMTKVDLIPSMTTTTYMLFKVTNGGGTNVTNTTANQEVYSETSGTLTASFRYGDSAANQKKLQALFDSGELKIVLLKKSPQIGSEQVSWVDQQYGGTDQPFGKPVITKQNGSNDFTVTFAISKDVTGQNYDGAQFRILVWTDVNGTKEDGTSYTGTDIKDALNGATGNDNPFNNIIPSHHINVSMLYKVVTEGATTSTVTVLATADKISLTAQFKYNFDQNRYPDNSFTAGMLTQLINGNKIQVKLEKQMKGGQWEDVAGVDKTTLAAGDNGIINFAYDFTDTDLSAYEGAQFRVTVWSNANGTPYPTHTITVTYVADPTAYVDIPKYIILDDNSSKVVEGNAQQDGYAGKQVVVKYNDATMTGTFKPSIEVKVQDGVKMKKGSISGTEMADMTIGIYNNDGAKIQATDGYSSIGTLNTDTTSLPFWMNVKRGNAMKNEQYYATVMFMLEMAGTMT